MSDHDKKRHDVLLDQRLFVLDPDQYDSFVKALDNPPPAGPKLKALMKDYDRDYERKLEVQIAELHAEVKSAQAVCDIYATENQQFHDEIERLRATLEDVCGAPTLRRAQSIAYTALNGETK